MPDSPKLCSKCGKEPAGPKGMCKPCAAEYQREYNKTRDEMAFRRGFAAGVEAQRKDYVDRWLWFPNDAMVTCAEVAKVLAETPRPSYTPKVIDTESDPVAKT
jgi:hypothetical protein